MAASKQTITTKGNQLMNTNQQIATPGTTPRKIAIAAGVLYLITHVTSIGAIALYDPVLNHADYILGAGSEAQVILGTILDILLALSIVGTAVALLPIVKRWNEGAALGYVGLRTLEAGIIAVGVIPLLAVVTLRQLAVGSAGSDPDTLLIAGHMLVAFYTWTTLLGPGLVCGVNTVLIASLMYKSRLVPRFIPVLGLVGGPVIFLYTVARMFGAYEAMPGWVGILVIPIFAWEVTLALWLIVKGFRSSAAASEPEKAATSELLSAV
jgi:hypothetical protein